MLTYIEREEETETKRFRKTVSLLATLVLVPGDVPDVVQFTYTVYLQCIFPL